MKKHIQHHFETTRLLFVARAAIVGILVGFIVSAFRWIIQRLLLGVQILYQQAVHQPLWLVLLLVINVAIGIIAALLLKSEPNISGSGIPQVEGQLAGELEVRWWSILWKKFATGILGLGAGLFLGREGPSIQLGAAVGQGVAEGRHFKGTDRRILIASGAAAGLAAAFNAPISGALFVLEEIYHNFSPLVWLTSLTSAIMANVVSLAVFGETPVLHLNYQQSLPLNLYWHLILLGILLGLLGFAYQKILLAMPQLYGRLKNIPRRFDGLFPLVLVVGLGYLAPHILGGGNEIVLDFNQSLPSLKILLLLFAVRFIFSMISYGSGLPGGIFLPILSLGALIGAIYGVTMSDLGLLPHALIVNCIIFSMAGYFACIGKAPFTAIILVTEMVGSLRLLMPLAVLSLVSYLVVDTLGGAPIYASLLDRLTVSSKISQLHHADRLEIPVFVGSRFEAQQVRAIQWPEQSLLMEIRRGEKVLIPHGDTLIQAGDTLVVLTDHALITTVRRKLKVSEKS